jgi:hypothetical protein
MPLRALPSAGFHFDASGRCIHFRLYDADMAFVVCAVSVDYLLLRAAKDGFRNQNSSALFLLYRKDLERLASDIFDAGDERPLITASALCNSI